MTPYPDDDAAPPSWLADFAQASRDYVASRVDPDAMRDSIRDQVRATWPLGSPPRRHRKSIIDEWETYGR